jgi:hypothetical protein
MKTVIDLVETTKSGVIEVRQATYTDDGEVSYHRWTLLPGQDISKQEQSVKDVCAATWTPEVISAYQAKLNS